MLINREAAISCCLDSLVQIQEQRILMTEWVADNPAHSEKAAIRLHRIVEERTLRDLLARAQALETIDMSISEHEVNMLEEYFANTMEEFLYEC